MDARTNATGIIGAVILLAVLGCTTFLVATGELASDLFMGVVVGPIVGGVVGVVGVTRGVQQGANAAHGQAQGGP